MSKYKKLLFLNELAYQNNIGFHELTKFYKVASKHVIGQFENYLKKDQISKAIELLELTLKTVLNKSKMELT